MGSLVLKESGARSIKDLEMYIRFVHYAEKKDVTLYRITELPVANRCGVQLIETRDT